MNIVKRLKMAFDENCYSGEVLGKLPELVEIFRKGRAFHEENEDFNKRVLRLSKDVGLCNAPLKRSPNSQFWRRILIRNLFALIEGQIYGMKAVSVHRYEHLEVDFSAADLALLQEHKFKLNGKGETYISSDNYQQLVPNYKFAFRCFAKAHVASFQLDDSKATKLGLLEKVRHRLVHPKNLGLLSVTDDEMKLSQEVWEWHSDETCRLFAACKNDVLPVKHCMGKITGQLRLTQPFVLLWPDGTVYGFPTRRLAKAFANANSDKHPSGMNFFLHSAKDIQQGHFRT